MDVGRLSPSGRALRILLLAGLWLPMVQLNSSRNVFLRRRSNPDERPGDVKSIALKGRLQWAEEGLRQEGAGNRKKEEPAAAPVEANEGLERAGVPAPKDMFSASSCSPSSCKHGSCSVPKCICFFGYTGSNCNEVSPSCSGFFSCKKGFCMESKCLCYSGYTGAACDKVPTSCSFNTCVNGFCPPQKCVCSPGYKGPACDEVASCNSSTCIHGSCSSDDTCSCDNGFKGPTCNEGIITTTLTSATSTKACFWYNCNHGYCLFDKCFCHDGFSGPTCNEVSAFSSESSPCNTYTCMNGYCSSGKCFCEPGYTGPTCNQAISTRNYYWTTCLAVGLSLVIPIIICVFICFWKGPPVFLSASTLDKHKEAGPPGFFSASTLDKYKEADTKTTLTTAKVVENVYEDISVISSGRW